MLFAMVTFSLLSIFFTQLRIIVQPLVRLRDATKEIAKGSVEIVLPKAAQDEVGQLTDSFSFICLQNETFKR